MVNKKRFLVSLLVFILMLSITVPVSASQTVNPTAANVLVNGTLTGFEAYNIGGSNYFKLRDLAMALNGSNKQFSVGWDGAANAISLTSGQPYEAVGGELAQGDGAAKTASPTTAAIYLDSVQLNLTAYNIGGSNFFMLRDVMSALDIGVTWDSATSTIGIDTSIGYETDTPSTPVETVVDTTPTQPPVISEPTNPQGELPEGAEGWARAKTITRIIDTKTDEISIPEGEILPYRYAMNGNSLHVFKNGIWCPVRRMDHWEILD